MTYVLLFSFLFLFSFGSDKERGRDEWCNHAMTEGKCIGSVRGIQERDGDSGFVTIPNHASASHCTTPAPSELCSSLFQHYTAKNSCRCPLIARSPSSFVHLDSLLLYFQLFAFVPQLLLSVSCW